MANTQHFFVLQSDPEIERCKQRLLKERTLSPDQRMKRILARVQDLCNAKGVGEIEEAADSNAESKIRSSPKGKLRFDQRKLAQKSIGRWH